MNSHTLDAVIQMELDGRLYYEDQARLHEKDDLKTVFTLLAAEEEAHAALLVQMKKAQTKDLRDPVRPDFHHVFSGLAAYHSENKAAPDQLDVYRMALEKEWESVVLYEKLLSENCEEADLFTYLIRQENEHARLLEEIVKIVERPHYWVEAAEFGVREEY